MEKLLTSSLLEYIFISKVEGSIIMKASIAPAYFGCSRPPIQGDCMLCTVSSKMENKTLNA